MIDRNRTICAKGEKQHEHEYMVLGIGIREGILRVSVSDVSLAIGGLSQSFKRKVKDLAFRFLCYGSDCDHEYSGFSPGIVPGIESVDCMLVVL